jgi:multidrug efflux pump subunit AcrB
MRTNAKNLRNQLYRVNGVRKVSLFGVDPERIFVEVDNIRLAQYGIKASDITDAISRQNIVLPGGIIQANGSSFYVEPTGNFENLEQLENLQIKIPDKTGQVAYLKDIATISRGFADPP